MPENKAEFDNGVFRVECDDRSVYMPEFSTDYSSFATVEIECGKAAKLYYQLFPNKNMKLYVDGEQVEPVLKDGLIEISVPPGQHVVSYQYRNRLHQLFVPVFWIYVLMLGGIVAWRGGLRLHRKFLKGRDKTWRVST